MIKLKITCGDFVTFAPDIRFKSPDSSMGCGLVEGDDLYDRGIARSFHDDSHKNPDLTISIDTSELELKLRQHVVPGSYVEMIDQLVTDRNVLLKEVAHLRHQLVNYAEILEDNERLQQRVHQLLTNPSIR